MSSNLSNPAMFGPGATTGEAPLRTPSAEPDNQMVEQTRREIRAIAAEIGELARSNVSQAEFFDRFLPQVVSALGATGGAVWLVDEAGEVTLEYQVNLSAAALDGDPHRAARHTLLLRKSVAEGEAIAVPPQSGASSDDDAGNLTDFLVLLGPLHVGERTVGVVEIFQRTNAGPSAQRGYLRFLEQMVDLAADFLKSRQIKNFTDREQLWQQLEGFVRRAHASLHPRQTAYTIANEGRRLIGCDRATVLLKRGRRMRVEAVSGLDHVDARANQVRLLETLVDAAIMAGEPLWYRGEMSDVPPQIEEPLHAVLDETHASTLAVLPLIALEDEESSREQRPEPIGALLIEQLQSAPPAARTEHRAEAVAQHGAAALAQALEHHRIFLLPLWQWLGNSRAVLAARNLPKTLAVLLMVALVVGALALFPAAFEVEGRGTLEPVLRREIFATIDGAVDEVKVTHGSQVQPGQTLIELRSTSDLDVAITDLVGKKSSTQEAVASIERSLLGEGRLAPSEQDRLSGQLFQLRKTIDSIDAQLALYAEKQRQLTVTSPIAGQVATWQIQDRLMHRPVRKGQALLSVVNPNGDWELQVHMPQRRVGHLIRAAAASDEPLVVTFMLATHPGDEFTGHVVQIGQVADAADGQIEPTVLVRVAVNKVELPELRPGASVSARVDCGTRSLGYVWLHDIVEFVQSQILFRL